VFVSFPPPTTPASPPPLSPPPPPPPTAVSLGYLQYFLYEPVQMSLFLRKPDV
jgi:hypothetical protein